MVALELTEATADAVVFRDECVERVSCRVVHRHVGCELLGVAGVRDAVAELLVAARNQAMIEQTDILEDLAADEQTAGRRELLVFEVAFDWKAGVVVVSGSKWWVGGWCELDVTAHIVGVGGLDGFEGGFEPVFGDGHVGVDKDEDVAVSVSDAGVAGGIGGLDLAFVAEGYVVVVCFVAPDDLGGSVGGVVVDDDNLIVGGGLGEE